MILDVSTFGQHRGDEQIFRSCIGGALVNMQVLLADSTCRNGERCFTDSWRTDKARGQRQVFGVDDQPACEQLLQNFTLTDPFSFGRIGLTEIQANPVDFDRVNHEAIYFLENVILTLVTTSTHGNSPEHARQFQDIQWVRIQIDPEPIMAIVVCRLGGDKLTSMQQAGKFER